MKRTDALDAAPGGFFTDGNPLIPVFATVVDASWLNMVQEEIITVLSMAGIAPSALTQHQLYDAIEVLILGALAAHVAAANPHPQYVQHDAAQVMSLTDQYQARQNINAPSRAYAYFMGQC
jgi:hypothetical protein